MIMVRLFRRVFCSNAIQAEPVCQAVHPLTRFLQTILSGNGVCLTIESYRIIYNVYEFSNLNP